MGRHSLRRSIPRNAVAPSLRPRMLGASTADEPSTVENDRDSFWVEVGVLVIGRGLAGIGSAAVFVLAARHIDRPDFGRVASIVSVATILAIVLDGGLSTSILRSGGIDPTDRTWIRRQVKARVGFGFLCLVLFLVDGGGGFDASSSGLRKVFTLGALALLVASASWAEIFVLNALVAIRRSAWATVMQLGDRVVSLIVLVIFGMAGKWLDGLVWSQVLGPIFSGIFFVARPPRVQAAGRPRAGLQMRLRYLQTSLAVQAQNLEVPIVAGVSGSIQAAYIGLGSRLTGPLTLASNAGSNLILRGRPGTSNQTSRIMLVGGLASLPLFVCAALPSTALSPIVNSAYQSAIPVLRVVLIAAALNCLLQPVAADLLRVGHARLVARVVTLSMVVGLAGCAAGAAWDGAVGGAYGMLASQALQAGLFIRTRNQLTRAQRREKLS